MKRNRLKLGIAAAVMATMLGGVTVPTNTAYAMEKQEEKAIQNYSAGTEDAYLVIDDIMDLNTFASNVNSGNTYEGKIIKLGADIRYNKNATSSSKSFTPIGSNFKGTFDGCGHTISGINLSANQNADDLGFFSGLSSSATVKNLTIADSKFEGDEYIGAIAGWAGGTIDNCYVIANEISGTRFIGGIAGELDGGEIQNCVSANLSITGNYNAGGIVGLGGYRGYTGSGHIYYSGYGYIYNSCNIGKVIGTSTSIGGIIGYGNADVQNCYNVGIVESGAGIAGELDSSSNVSFSYYSDESAERLSNGVKGHEEGNANHADTYMSQEEFVNQLNTNREGIEERFRWELRKLDFSWETSSTDSDTELKTLREALKAAYYPLPVESIDISNYTVELSGTTFTYDGTEKKPVVTVKENGVVLDSSAYDLTYENNLNAGTATVIIRGEGMYMGSIKKNFTIKKATPTLSCSTTNIQAVCGERLREFEVEVSPKRETKHTIGDTNIIESTYEGYRANATGRTTLTISVPGEENYNAVSKKITITVKPVRQKIISLSSKKKKISVEWNKDDQASGYELQYSTDRKFKSNTKKITLTSKIKYSKKISGKKNKTYYVRVRSYKTSNGTKIYGAWSSLRKKKCK